MERGRIVMDQREAAHLSPRAPQPGPPCPQCKMPARYFTSLLDVKRNRSVLIYRCDGCREEIWA